MCASTPAVGLLGFLNKAADSARRCWLALRVNGEPIEDDGEAVDDEESLAEPGRRVAVAAAAVGELSDFDKLARIEVRVPCKKLRSRTSTSLVTLSSIAVIATAAAAAGEMTFSVAVSSEESTNAMSVTLRCGERMPPLELAALRICMGGGRSEGYALREREREWRENLLALLQRFCSRLENTTSIHHTEFLCYLLVPLKVVNVLASETWVEKIHIFAAVFFKQLFVFLLAALS